MNQFSIIYSLLAFFFFSHTPAQADRDVISKLTEAVVSTPGKGSRSFKKEAVLYKITGMDRSGKSEMYEIEDESKYSERFPITEGNTVVADGKITVEWHKKLITLSVEANTFEFCLKFFTLGNYAQNFPVTQFTQDGQTVEDVSAIKAKQGKDGEWYCVALKGGKPCLIFPRKSANFLGGNNNVTTQVLKFHIDYTLPTVKLSVRFDTSATAHRFYQFAIKPNVV